MLSWFKSTLPWKWSEEKPHLTSEVPMAGEATTSVLATAGANSGQILDSDKNVTYENFPSDSSSWKHLTSTSSTSSSSIPQLLPHIVTERSGGRDLWVTAPVHAGWLEKQGFHWRKKWTLRWVELRGRTLAYYEAAPVIQGKEGNEAMATPAAQPLYLVQLSGTTTALHDIDDTSFHVLVARDGKQHEVWKFRSASNTEKMTWLFHLNHTLDILKWLEHYRVGRFLGKGGNGVVKEICDSRDETKKYAVKIINVSESSRQRKDVVAEIEVLKAVTQQIKHPNLIQMYKVYEELGRVYIVMQLCTGGELYERIVEKKTYSEVEAARLMKKILLALQALHSHNILHLDLKPENILYESGEEDAEIRLTDFGLARVMDEKCTAQVHGSAKRPRGTVGYMSPEIILAGHYGPAADIFSAGVILYILLVGYPPFYAKNQHQMLQRTIEGKYDMKSKEWAYISESAQNLVRKMLTYQYDERISLTDALQHPWIATEGSSDLVCNPSKGRMKLANLEGLSSTKT